MKIGEDLLEVYLGVFVKIWNVYGLYSAISSSLKDYLLICIKMYVQDKIKRRIMVLTMKG